MHALRFERDEDGVRLPLWAWRPPTPATVVSTAAVGGGLGPCAWVLNAQVAPGYARTDLDGHVADLARVAGLPPGGADARGVGLLTAADVDDLVAEAEPLPDGDEVRAWVTAGVRVPTWAASHAAADPDLAGGPAVATPGRVGTINVVVWVPRRCADGALVNLATTATEAKAQALGEVGIAGTGTASDAVAVVAVSATGTGPGERFGGPRSPVGAPVARVVRAAVVTATARSLVRIDDERRARGLPAWRTA